MAEFTPQMHPATFERLGANERLRVLDPPRGNINNWDDVWNAAALDTSVGQIATDLYTRYQAGATYKAKENWNVFKDHDLSGYEPFLEDFLGVLNPEEAEARKMLIDINKQRRQELDSNNAFWTRMAGNVLDPLNFVPVPILKGLGFVRGFGTGAVAIGGLVAGSEVVRHSVDPTSTVGETALNIGGAVILGGALGGLVGSFGKSLDSSFSLNGVSNKHWGNQDAIDIKNKMEADLPGSTEGLRPIKEPEIQVVDSVADVAPVSKVARSVDDFEITDASPEFTILNTELKSLEAESSALNNGKNKALDDNDPDLAALIFNEIDVVKDKIKTVNAKIEDLVSSNVEAQKPSKVSEPTAASPKAATFEKPAFYDPNTNIIHIHEAGLKEKFRTKAWMTPKEKFPEVKAMPEDAFKTYEEFRAYIVRHEQTHSHVRPTEFETTGAYEQRVTDIAMSKDRFADIKAVANNFDPEGLAPTNLKLEQTRWRQAPFFVMKNNLFEGHVKSAVGRFADQVFGTLGLMTKGNKAGTQESAQGIYILAQQHNVLMVNARNGVWDAFVREQGIDPDLAGQSALSRAALGVKLTAPIISKGGGKRWDDFGEEVMTTYIDPSVVPRNEHVAQAVKAFSDYMAEMGKRAKEVGAFGRTRLESLQKYRTESLSRLEDKITRFEQIHDDLSSVERMSKKEKDYRDLLRDERIPEAKALREEYVSELDRVNAALDNPNSLPVVEPDAPAHFPRMWLMDVVRANREVLEKILERHFDNDATRGARVRDTVDNILKIGKIGQVSRELGSLMELAGAPKSAIDSTMNGLEAIGKKRGLTKAEKLQDARVFVDKVVRMYGLGEGTAKSIKNVIDEIDMLARTQSLEADHIGLMSRKLDLPSHLFANIPELNGKSFIEMNPERILRTYHKRMSLNIESAREFGDPFMQNKIDDLGDLMDDQIEAYTISADWDKAAALTKERTLQMGVFKEAKERVFGTFGMPEDPSALSVRAVQFSKNWMTMALMGKVLYANFADVGRIAMALGIERTFVGAFEALTTAAREFRKAGGDIVYTGEVSEVATHARYQQITGTDTIYSGNTKIERMAEGGAQGMFLINGLAAFTDISKTFLGVHLQSEFISAAVKWSTGKPITPRERATFLRLGINKDRAKKVYEQWVEAGSEGPGNGTNKLYLSNTNKWTDIETQRIFRGALTEEIRTGVVTPGPGDKLSFMHTPIGGMLTQFKAFGISATSRTTMAGLQQRDARAFQGLLSMIAFGYFVDAIKSNELDNRDYFSADRLLQAIDHSGATGIFFDLNNMLEQTSGAISGSPLGVRPMLGVENKFGDPTGTRAAGQVLGPSVGLYSDLISSLVGGDGSERLKAVRRLIPFNQVVWWAGTVNKIEREAIELTE